MQNTMSDFNNSQRTYHRRRTYVNVVLTDLIQGKLATEKTFQAFELPFVSAITGLPSSVCVNGRFGCVQQLQLFERMKVQ